MKISYSDIVKSLPVTKNSKSSWWVKLWVRKASFFLTFFCINLGLSSNQVSYISIVVAIAACIFFGIATPISLIIGAFLINLWLVLDCVDGNIARCLNQKKKYGEFIDAMSGYVTVAFVYLALGVTVYQIGGIFADEKNILFIIIGAIASISDILARLIYRNFMSVPNEVTKKTKDEKKENKKSFAYIRKRIGKELGISGLFMLATILSVIFNSFDIVVIFYFLFNLMALLSTIIVYAYKAEKIDKLT